MAQHDGVLKRVLDLRPFMAGPMAAVWLVDFGADVTRVDTRAVTAFAIGADQRRRPVVLENAVANLD